jgi:hypothetical protein
MRLFIAACCRRVAGTAADYRFRYALAVIERLADGLAAAEEVGRMAALADARPGPLKSRWLAVASALAAVPAASAAASAAGVAAAAAGVGAPSGEAFEAFLAAERAAQADLVREVMGNPFRPPAVEPAVLSWKGGAVPRLAQDIYEARAFDCLPALADILEEAGCADEALLAHCRGPGPHARGCWLLDLVRGAEVPCLPGQAGPPAPAAPATGGAPTAPSGLSDRRACPRHRVVVSLRCRVFLGELDLAGCAVVDLSASGAGLSVPRPLAEGTLLALVLSNVAGRYQHAAGCAVARCESEGPYRVGVAFDRPLSNSQLQLLLW